MRYPLYLRILDGFGAFSVASAVAYIYLPESIRPSGNASDVWSGVTTEFIGIWIGVRFIDWALRYHESFTKARVRVVRNMRYQERLFLQVGEFRRTFEYRMLLREVSWIRSKWQSRAKHLRKDEINDVLQFNAIADELLSMLPSQDKLSIRESFHLDNEEEYFLALQRLEEARLVAEENIFEETDEDEGM